MVFKWDDSLLTGNRVIDTQHKQLIDALNQLVDSSSKGLGRAELDSKADFLYNYLFTHFEDEERLQINSGYPDYPEHKKKHEEFKETAILLLNQVKTQGATIALTGKINLVFGEWLFKHIKKEDVKLATYLRDLGK